MGEEHVINKHQAALAVDLSFRSMHRYAKILTACPTVEKKPSTIRAAMKELKVMAAPHHAAVHSDVVRNQKKTGARPK